MNRTPDETKQALEDLLKSDGWEVLCALVYAKHGPAAQVAEFRSHLQATRPEDIAGQQASFAIIDAANRGALAVLDLPATHLRGLDEQQQPRARLFDQFRRTRNV